MKSAVTLDRSEIARQSPGVSSQGVTSNGLGWSGFSLVEYFGDEGERPEQFYDLHIIGLWQREIATGESPNGLGGYVPYTRYPGTVTLIPPSLIRKHRAHNPYQVTLCLFESSFVKRVGEELDQQPTEEFRLRANVEDVPMRQLITLLSIEAREGGSSGKLYADHLAHSIAIRLFSLGAEIRPRDRRAVSSPLPRHLLSRVLDRMRHFNSNLDLRTLAAETGYSRTHFLRMFQLSTGYTPHRYLVQLRLQRAQELMKQRSLSLIDIAASSGFSSNAHLSRMFRQFLGITPSEYRRKL